MLRIIMGNCQSRAGKSTSESDIQEKLRQTEGSVGGGGVQRIAWGELTDHQLTQPEKPSHSLTELQAEEEPRLEAKEQELQAEQEELKVEEKKKEEEIQTQQQQLQHDREERMKADKEWLEAEKQNLKMQQNKLKDEKKRNEEEIRTQQELLQNDREKLKADKERLKDEKQKLQIQQSNLKDEKKRKEEEIQKQQKELKADKERLKDDKQELQMQQNKLKDEKKRYDKQLQDYKKLTSASRDSRKRYKDIRPGDITHETLLSKFQDYYGTKFRPKLKKLNYSTKEDRCCFLSTVLKVACRYCNGRVMEHMTEELSALYKPPLSPRCMDPDQLLQDQSHEKWRDRSAAFGLLLSVADIDSKQLPAWIKFEEVQEILKSESELFKHACVSNFEIAKTVLNSALDIAWIMSTLVPPPCADEPGTFYPQWHEIVTTSDPTVDPECDPYSLTYCRPVLFFGAEGTVGNVGYVKCFPLTNDDQSEIVIVEEQQVQQPIDQSNQSGTGDTIPEKSGNDQTEQEDKFYDAVNEPDTLQEHTTTGFVTLQPASQLEVDNKLETPGNSSDNNESIHNVSQDIPNMVDDNTPGPDQANSEQDTTSSLSAQVTEVSVDVSKFPKLDVRKANDCVQLSSANSNGADHKTLNLQNDSNGCTEED